MEPSSRRNTMKNFRSFDLSAPPESPTEFPDQDDADQILSFTELFNPPVDYSGEVFSDPWKKQKNKKGNFSQTSLIDSVDPVVIVEGDCETQSDDEYQEFLKETTVKLHRNNRRAHPDDIDSTNKFHREFHPPKTKPRGRLLSTKYKYGNFLDFTDKIIFDVEDSTTENELELEFPDQKNKSVAPIINKYGGVQDSVVKCWGSEKGDGENVDEILESMFPERNSTSKAPQTLFKQIGVIEKSKNKPIGWGELETLSDDVFEDDEYSDDSDEEFADDLSSPNETLELPRDFGLLPSEKLRHQHHQQRVQKKVNSNIRRGKSVTEFQSDFKSFTTNPTGEPVSFPSKSQSNEEFKKIIATKNKCYRTRVIREMDEQREREREDFNAPVSLTAEKAGVSVEEIKEVPRKNNLSIVRNEALMDRNLDWGNQIIWGEDCLENLGTKSYFHTTGPSYYDPELNFVELTPNSGVDSNYQLTKEFDEVLHKFRNLHRDDCYDNRGGGTVEKTGKRVAQHSKFAKEFDEIFYPTDYKQVDVQNLHKPQLKFELNKEYSLFSSKPKKARRSRKPKTIRNLSTKNSRIVLLENVEETPSLINKPGMGTMFRNYVKLNDETLGKGGLERIKFDDGDKIPVQNEKEIPVAGGLINVDGAEVISTTENNLFSSQLFKFRLETDFLISMNGVGDNGGKLHVRNVPTAYTVGHIQPVATVPAPKPKRQDTSFQENRLEQWAKQKLMRQGFVYQTTLDSAFPSMSKAKITKKMKEFGVSSGRGDARFWKVKKDVILNKKKIREIVKPEMVVRHESLLRGKQQLEQTGITLEISSVASGAVDFQIPKEKEEMVGYVEKQVNNTPWNETFSFTKMMNGEEELDLELLKVARANLDEGERKRFQESANEEVGKETYEFISQSDIYHFLKKGGYSDEQIIKMKGSKKKKALEIRDRVNGISEDDRKQLKKQSKLKARGSAARETISHVFSRESQKIQSGNAFYDTTDENYVKKEFDENLLDEDDEFVESAENDLLDMFGESVSESTKSKEEIFFSENKETSTPRQFHSIPRSQMFAHLDGSASETEKSEKEEESKDVEEFIPRKFHTNSAQRKELNKYLNKKYQNLKETRKKVLEKKRRLQKKSNKTGKKRKRENANVQEPGEGKMNPTKRVKRQ